MHGRRKIKTSEDKLREKKEEERKKSIMYSNLLKELSVMRNENIYTKESLDKTSTLLAINADAYSVWNFRRQILLSLIEDKSNIDVYELMNGELIWLKNLISRWPKSYWIWHQRCWISKYIDVDWDNELSLCLKMHKLDSRNFHCWNYRRFVTHKAKVSPKTELDVTLSLIEENFSNYSAWHHRSINLEDLFKDEPQKYKEAILEELELVKQAFFTEPSDQSSWIYHRWLLGKSRIVDKENHLDILQQELNTCNELLEIESESKWALLTKLRLMVELNGDSSEINSTVEKLKEIDPHRQQYYVHIAAKN